MTKENNNQNNSRFNENHNQNYNNPQLNEDYNQNYDNSQLNENYNQNYDDSQFNGDYIQNYHNSQFNENYNQNYDNSQYNEDYNHNYNSQYNNYNNGQNDYYQNSIPPVNSNYNNNQNYNAPQFNNTDSKNEKEKKSIIPVILTAIITFAVLVVGLYFGYNKFMKKENVADISTYEVNFVAYGTDGEGKPEVDIKKTPAVDNNNSEISNLLSNPDVVFDKQSGLKNGDKVEVTITINQNTAQKLNLKTTGEFKRIFTVSGLNEKSKEKETVIVRDNSNSSSSSNSSNNRNRIYFSNKATRIFVEAGVNLRSNSDDTSTVLATAKKGDTVYVDFTETNDKGEEWSYVSYNGKKGWMRTDLIGH